MKLKRILLLAIGAAPLAAHADWQPVVYNDDYVVTLGGTVNNGYRQSSDSEGRYSGNYLPSIARDVYSITNSRKTELNSQVRDMATREGLTFSYSNLYGNANVTLQPNGAGYLTSQI